jgi:hypothetical protein
MGLINETNAEYYSGEQIIISDNATSVTQLFSNFDELLINSGADIYSGNPPGPSNFEVYESSTNLPYNWTLISESLYTVQQNTIIFNAGRTKYAYKVKLVLKDLNTYAYVSINDIVNNFMLAYIGDGKVITRVKKSDVIFHAKRGLQEFSYDVLRSVQSQELNIPPSLSVAIPQDYVNYVRVSCIDESGVKRPIYPANNLTISPTELPIQDNTGEITQDNYGQNLEANTSITEHRWNDVDVNDITGYLASDTTNVWNYDWWRNAYGQRYGQDQTLAQKNGWFQINERNGTFSFSNELHGKLITLEYISDGLAYNGKSQIPKMAEDALYSHILYSLCASRPSVPEYIVQRYKKDRSTKLRNAKIRLSNLKPIEMTQNFRGKSKWLKF